MQLNDNKSQFKKDCKQLELDNDFRNLDRHMIKKIANKKEQKINRIEYRKEYKINACI